MGRQKGEEWDHVSILKKHPKGMHVMQCKYCNHTYVGGPQRIRVHLLGLRGQGVEKCKYASNDVKLQIKRLMGIASEEVVSNVDAPAPNENQSITSTSISENEMHNVSQPQACSETRKKIKSGASGSLQMAWKMQLRKNAEEALARFFYAEDIPHGKVESSFFHDLLKAVGQVGPSFKPPSAYQLRNKYLNAEVKTVELDLSQIKEHWKTYGCTIVSDGWSDTSNRPIINVMASSMYGSVFLKSVDTSGHVRTGEYIFKILKDVILEVGPSNVVQVCMDNATNCMVAGEMIEKEWPSIFYTRCTCHCVDLLFEDIARLAWIDDILRAAMKITIFITRKQYVLAMFRSFSEKELLKSSNTRFAYSFIVLSNLLDARVYGGLRRMIASEQWGKWKGSKTKKAEEIVAIISDARFWSDVKLIVTLCRPILKLLRLADREGATMGLIYGLTQQMIEEINNMSLIEIDLMKLDEIKLCCRNRWSMLQSPLHLTGYVLHPMWTGNGQEINNEMNTGWMTTIMRYASGNQVLQNALIDEFYAYRKQTCNMFRLPFAKDLNRMKNSVMWWETFGTATPNLMKLAIRVLSQGSTASPCGRNWSTFSLIHTKRRKRLSPGHVEKLVYLKTNLRLLKRIKDRGYAPLEITMEMVDKEEDSERLLNLQKEQEMLQSENSNDILNSMQDEDNMEDNYVINGNEAHSSENPQTYYHIN